MKASRVFCLFLFCVSFSSCASTADSNKVKCADINVEYVRSMADSNGNAVGLFSVENRGKDNVIFPLENKSLNVIHARHASVEVRYSEDEEWRPFNPLLDEMLVPEKNIAILPGQRVNLVYDANGLFLLPLGSDRRVYSVVIRDSIGCAYRSIPFRP